MQSEKTSLIMPDFTWRISQSELVLTARLVVLFQLISILTSHEVAGSLF